MIRVPKNLMSKVVTGIAYGVIGSEVVRDNLTADNARKVANMIGRGATTTGRGVKSAAGRLQSAVRERKKEILAAKDDEESEI